MQAREHSPTMTDFLHSTTTLLPVALAGFFAMMNPIALAPAFLSLTSDLDRRTQQRVAIRATIIAFVIVALFAVSGSSVLSIFGITLPAVRIFGGLVVGIIGFNMLSGSSATAHAPAPQPKGPHAESPGLGIAVSPLAMPLMAGPGTLATALSLTAHGPGDRIVPTLVALAAVCILCCVCFLLASELVKLLGHQLIAVISKIMGLILGVIGVQMATDGVQSVVRALQ